MNLNFDRKKSYIIISMEGKLDSLNAQEIYSIIENKIKDYDKNIIFDFKNLEYMTSAGLQLILMVSKNRSSKGKSVLIYKPQKIVDYVLQVSGFYSFVEKIIGMPEFE